MAEIRHARGSLPSFNCAAATIREAILQAPWSCGGRHASADQNSEPADPFRSFDRRISLRWMSHAAAVGARSVFRRVGDTLTPMWACFVWTAAYGIGASRSNCRPCSTVLFELCVFG